MELIFPRSFMFFFFFKAEDGIVVPFWSRGLEDVNKSQILMSVHNRNGILLAPVTARAIGAFLLTGLLPEEARPFQPSRFAA